MVPIPTWTVILSVNVPPPVKPRPAVTSLFTLFAVVAVPVRLPVKVPEKPLVAVITPDALIFLTTLKSFSEN